MSIKKGKRVEILGIGVDNVTMPQALEILDGFVNDGEPRIVVTADAAGIVAAHSDEVWRKIMLNADLVTPDSVGVLWAADHVGKPMKERVSGVDLVERLVEKGYSTYFLGAAPGIAESAREKLVQKYPNANIIGTRDGFFGEADEAEIVCAISKAKPQVLLVAMGIPKQEKFIAKHMAKIGAAVNMGVGGSFDVLSGSVKRAPKLLQKMRLEWLWRLVQNPKKWRKVAALPSFWWMVMTSGRRSKSH
jgi:N-acetylglucosaminyldiphosphoundecaprenol N-acetyl-beta-D-mannosaminyltransferase